MQERNDCHNSKKANDRQKFAIAFEKSSISIAKIIDKE